MRFNVEIELKEDTIPKDKNRIFLSFFKHIFKNYDEEYFNKTYVDNFNKIKDYTWSLYIPDCKFLREDIIVPNKKIFLNYSTSNVEDGIIFYNSILNNINKPYDIKNNSFIVKKINMVSEKVIKNSSANYKIMSPIVVREHGGDNAKTWYYDLNDEKGQEIFMENLKYQLLNKFGESRKLDIEEIEFELINNKTVKVKNYDIEVLGNICKFTLTGKSYILDYLYKSGIGSKRSSGFGMVDIL